MNGLGSRHSELTNRTIQNPKANQGYNSQGKRVETGDKHTFGYRDSESLGQLIGRKKTKTADEIATNLAILRGEK